MSFYEYPKFQPCHHCKVKGSKPEGFVKKTKIIDGKSVGFLEECLHYKVWRLKKEAYNRFIQNGFDKNYFDINMCEDGDYVGVKALGNIVRLRTYIEKFYEDERVRAAILYFYGAPDTQIKETVHWIANRLIEKYNVVIEKHGILFTKYANDTWSGDKDEELNYTVNKYRNCDLLIIDNFDVGTFTEKQHNLFDTFVKERMDNNKGIIFCANKSIFKMPNCNLKHILDSVTTKLGSEFFFTDLKNDIPDVLF